MNKETKNIILVFAGAMLCCFLWGSAFPGIKVGYDLWNIDSSDTISIIRFAGVRFFLAGILVIILGSIIQKKPLLPRKDEIPLILFLSLFQTIGQYVFFYLGLAHTTGVNSAVVDSLTTFFAIILAAFLFHTEKLTGRKLIGCALGFTGVLIINLNGSGFHLNPLGDGLIALSAICYGVSSNLIKKYSSDHDTVLFSGYQFMFGGLIMAIPTFLINKKTAFTGASAPASAVLILIYLALVSSVAYTLWGILLRNNDVSRISIYGFMTPVFGVILSAMFLGEAGLLGIKHIISLILIAAGILIVNLNTSSQNKTEEFENFEAQN